MELIVFIIMAIVALIMKSSQGGAGKSPARPPVPGEEKYKNLQDILFAELERAKRRKAASQYGRQYDREFDPRSEWEDERRGNLFPESYKIELQQQGLKKKSERKKRPAAELSPPAITAIPPAARPLKEGMRRAAGTKGEGGRALQQQLVDLLGSEKIALGVIASEVLSSPRAKRPFGYRR